jgi:hypothetical protein
MANDRPTGRSPFEIIQELEDISGGLGDWVENATPTNPVTQAIQGRFRAQCDSYSNAPEWFKNLQTPGQRGVALICDPYLDSVGSGPPVVSPPPFQGGQCDGVLYNIAVFFERDTGGGASSVAFFDVPGPVSSITNEDNPTRFTARVIADDGNYNQVRFGSFGGPYVITDIEVDRADGQPDNCGNPPGGGPAPNPNPRPDPGLDPGDEPFVDPKGRPVFPGPEVPNPFGDPIQLPNLPIPDPFAPNPDDAPPEPIGGEPTEPGDKGEPDSPIETETGGEEEQTDPNRWLMGVFVAVTEAPPRASGFQTSAGFVYTEAGFVYQGAGDELEYFEESERLLSGGQYFPATRGYDTWRVVAAPFYRLEVTPFYKEKEE